LIAVNFRGVVAFSIVGAALMVIAPRVSALGNPPSWREEVAKGHYPYHRLTAADFPINDTFFPEFGMHTHGFFQFHYHEQWTENNGHGVARITAWNVWSGFDRNKSSRKSWFKQVQETLPHEQGHLDINELFSKRLAETPLNKLPIGEGSTGKEAEADLKRKMNALADRFSAEEKVEQERYDAETNHGRNSAKQQEWTASIQARLQRAGIHF
jgi:Bacterial protein of unknown function (DUF922)